ncbi:MAG: profilin [Nannocystis sp.]|nr:profilin [Nannocystis sp.]
MTQWQGFVDNNLTGTGFVTMGAILGTNGSMWAFTPGLPLTQAEAMAIVKAFSDIDPAWRTGLMVGGQKYSVIRDTQASSVSVLKCMKGMSGFVANKTAKSVVFGMFNETIQPAQAANVVAQLANYLTHQGY